MKKHHINFSTIDHEQSNFMPVRSTTPTPKKNHLPYHGSLTGRSNINAQNKIEKREKSINKYRGIHTDQKSSKLGVTTQLNTIRPLTSFVTLDSNNNYCCKQDAQNLLKQSIKDDLTDFLVRRIKTSTKKNSQLIDPSNYFFDVAPATIDAQIFSDSKNNSLKSPHPKNYSNMKISEKLLQKNTLQNNDSINKYNGKLIQVVNQPYLVNLKQKLRRIVQKKKQQQQKHKQMKKQIQMKMAKSALQYSPVLIKNDNFLIEGRQTFKNNSLVLRQNIEKQFESEKKRYRNRLLSMHAKRINSSNKNKNLDLFILGHKNQYFTKI